MKKTKRLICVLLVCAVVIGAMFASALSASAVAAPGSAYWDGMTARWSAAEGEPVMFYRLELLCNDTVVRMEYPTDTSFDFSSAITSSGAGNYQFRVATAVGNAQEDTSEFTYSAVYAYNSGAGEHTLTNFPFRYPTCTEKGDKGHYECSHCGKWFWDENAQNEIVNHDDAFTEALGHNWGDWVTVKEATKDAEGEMKRVCNNDDSHVETKAIPKLGGDTQTEKPSETAAPTASGETLPTQNKDGEKAMSLLGGGLLTVVLIIAAALILTAAAVVIIVILVKRNNRSRQREAEQEVRRERPEPEEYEPPARHSKPDYDPPARHGRPEPKTQEPQKPRNKYDDPFDGQ